MVTIRDVARLAGVSPATVSQALNGRGRVHVRTRERVALAATKLRYAPNLSGRRLARRRAECVAVLQGRNMTTVFNDSFYRVVLGGVAEVTQARRYSLVFTPPPVDAATDADLNRMLGHGAVDGVLVVGALDGGLLLALRHRGLPVVLVDSYVPGVDLPAVVPDYQAGARTATEHLLRLGHRRVAFLGAAVSYPFGRQTLEGYGDALAGVALAQDPALIRRTEISVEAATVATRDLLTLPQTWAVIAARTMTDPVWFFITDWFAIYLVSKGIDREQSLLAFWIPFLAADLGNFFGGGVSSWLIRRGWPVIKARKAVVVFGGLGMTLLIPTIFTSDLLSLAGLFAVSTFAYASFSTMALVLPSDLYDNASVATVSGMSGTGAGLGTILSTFLIGYVADYYSFEPILITASLIPFVGMILVLILIRDKKPTPLPPSFGVEQAS